MNFWDVERYKGLHTPEFTWVSVYQCVRARVSIVCASSQTTKTQYVVFPAFSDANPLTNLRFADFVEFMRGHPERGFLFIGAPKSASCIMIHAPQVASPLISILSCSTSTKPLRARSGKTSFCSQTRKAPSQRRTRQIPKPRTQSQLLCGKVQFGAGALSFILVIGRHLFTPSASKCLNMVMKLRLAAEKKDPSRLYAGSAG